MKSTDYWQMFLDTGAPEYYLLYNRAQKMENENVFDGTGPGFEGHSV